MNNKGVGLVEIILAIALVIVIILLITGCEEMQTESTLSTVGVEYSDFKLKADEKTGVIYVDNVIRPAQGQGFDYIHIYTPYYSENGKLCRFVDGKVVEINDD